MGQQQLEGQREGGLLVLAAYEVRAGEHVGPLIVAAALQRHVVAVVELQEVVGLHQHVVELQEGQAALQALLVALRRQHAVDGEQRAHVPQEVDVIQIPQPVRVVHDLRAVGLGFIEIQEALHLLFDVGDVVVDVLHGQHLPEVALAAGVADHARAAAHQREGLVSSLLQVGHGHDRNVVADVQAVRGGVEAHVEGHHALVKGLVQLVLKGDLPDKSALFQKVQCVHGIDSFLFDDVIQPCMTRPSRAMPSLIVGMSLMEKLSRSVFMCPPSV